MPVVATRSCGIPDGAISTALKKPIDPAAKIMPASTPIKTLFQVARWISQEPESLPHSVQIAQARDMITYPDAMQNIVTRAPCFIVGGPESSPYTPQKNVVSKAINPHMDTTHLNFLRACACSKKRKRNDETRERLSGFILTRNLILAIARCE